MDAVNQLRAVMELPCEPFAAEVADLVAPGNWWQKWQRTTAFWREDAESPSGRNTGCANQKEGP